MIMRNAQVADVYVQFERGVGDRPTLPDSPEKRVAAFDKLCIDMAKLLPATDPDVTTRKSSTSQHIR